MLQQEAVFCLGKRDEPSRRGRERRQESRRRRMLFLQQAGRSTTSRAEAKRQEVAAMICAR